MSYTFLTQLQYAKVVEIMEEDGFYGRKACKSIDKSVKEEKTSVRITEQQSARILRNAANTITTTCSATSEIYRSFERCGSVSKFNDGKWSRDPFDS